MRSSVKFFLITYATSWFIFALAALIWARTASPSGPNVLSSLLFLPGVIAPSLVALALTAQQEGRAGVIALLRRITELPSGPQWYVFAIGYMAVIKLGSALVHRLVTGGWPPFGQEPILLMLGAILISTPFQAGEEIGWRGYALPRLAKQLGLARASILLGVIWACWHLPFFFIAGTDSYGRSFPSYLLNVTALAVAMSWLYWRTNGSLFLTMLMHASINNTAGIVSSVALVGPNPFAISTSFLAWLTTALLWIGAIYFLVRMRGATLEPKPVRLIEHLNAQTEAG
jgi:uncharacterized protein